MSGRGLLFAGLSLLLILSPLQYGGNRPLSMAAIEIVAALLAAAMAVIVVRDPEGTLPFLAPLRWPLILAGMVILWSLIQTASWTPTAFHHPVWAMAGEALGIPVEGAVAVRPDAAWFKAMLLLSYVVVFLAAFLIGLDTGGAHRLMLLCILCPAIYAAYGLILKALGLLHEPIPPVLNHVQIYRENSGVPGPFANSGHFALYLVMGVTCTTALFVQRAREVDFGGSWKQRLGMGIETVMGFGLPGLAILFMMITAIILGASRAGLFLTIGSFALIGLATWYKLSSKGRPVLAVGAAVLLVPGLLLVLQLSGDQLTNELSRNLTGEDILDVRMVLWTQSVHMISDAPLLGSGLMAFQDLYPLYSEGGPLGFHFKDAHNDYLGTVIALGLPAALCWFAALARIYGLCLYGTLLRSRRLPYVLAPAVVMTLTALHALVDFGLEIPANALLFSVLMGMGCAQAGDNAASRRRQGLA